MLLLLFISAATLLRCSTNLAGGGSESGNPVIIGKITDTNGAPVQNARITAIRPDYNPAIDVPIPDSYNDTTDASGIYCLRVSDSGSYNIQGMHLTQKTHFLMTDIFIAGDTTYVNPATLQDPGFIKALFPDTIDTAQGYVYIKGTTVYKRLVESSYINDELTLVIDAVPAGHLPSVYYDKLNTTPNPLLLLESLTITSNDTTIVDPFTDWVQYTGYNSGLPENCILDVHICFNSFPWLPEAPTIWFSTYSAGMAVFNRTSWTLYNYTTSGIPSDLPNQTISDENAIWIATVDGLIKYDGYSWRLWNTKNGLPYDNVTCIALNRSGDIWAGMDEGIGFFDKNTEQWIIYDTVTTGLSGHYVQGVTVDKNDNPWFATSDGVGRYDGVFWKVYTTASGLFSDITSCAATDSGNNVWIGHRDGISRFDGTTWFIYNYGTSEILQGRTNAIVPDKYNNIWICTKTGLTMFDGTTWHDFNRGKYSFLNNKIVHDIAFDDRGTAWLCTESDGVFAFRPALE